jgi:hypothetical protein
LWSCMLLTLLVLPAAYAMWRRGQVRASLRAAQPPDAPAAVDDAPVESEALPIADPTPASGSTDHAEDPS